MKGIRNIGKESTRYSDALCSMLKLWRPIFLQILAILARRRAAAKKKLKNLGKSKSTDTEEEEQDEDCGDDGQYTDVPFLS